jgi:hypothetical protein
MNHVSVAIIHLMMAAIYPNGDHVHDAQDIGEEIARTDPTLFEAAMLVETAFRESAFERSAVGPDGRDLCAYQLRDAPRTVLVDLRQCTEIALERLRYSYHHCPDHPLAIYTGGACESVVGLRFDRWRMVEVMRIFHVAEDQ